MQPQLNESLAQLMTGIVRVTPHAVLACDATGCIRFANDAALSVVAATKEQCIGVALGDAFPGSGIDVSKKRLRGMRFVPAWTHKSILIDFEIREVEIEGDTWKILFLQDAEQNRRRELILEKEASTDELSGLANRRAFQRCLESHQNHALVLAILDIDHFKNINDLYGHPTGDEVIRHTGKLLNEAFSKSSLVVARLGGDEFGILFDAATVKAASSALEEFCHRIKLTGSPECSEFSYSVSIGISIAEKAGVAPRELLTVADKALYQAKNAGRNCVRSKKIQKS